MLDTLKAMETKHYSNKSIRIYGTIINREGTKPDYEREALRRQGVRRPLEGLLDI